MVSVAQIEQHNCPLMSSVLIDDQQFQNQNVAKDTKKLNVFTGKGFAMKIGNEETRKSSRQ